MIQIGMPIARDKQLRKFVHLSCRRAQMKVVERERYDAERPAAAQREYRTD